MPITKYHWWLSTLVGIVTVGCSASSPNTTLPTKSDEPATRKVISLNDFFVDTFEEVAEIPCFQKEHTSLELDGFVHLEKVKTLKCVDIFRAKIENGSLEHLKALPRLESVSLVEVKISLEELNVLKDFPRLRGVTFRSTKLPKGAEKCLAEMIQLDFLDISDTGIRSEVEQFIRQHLPLVAIVTK